MVVDDKPDNIELVRSLAQEYMNERIIIQDYLMRLRDREADATAFFRWLTYLKEAKAGQAMELILDFDGVVADTDGVLFGPAVDNLHALLLESK